MGHCPCQHRLVALCVLITHGLLGVLGIFLGLLSGFLLGCGLFSIVLSLGRGIGLAIRTAATTIFALNIFHHDRRTLGGFFGLCDEATQNSIVIAEGMLELFECFLVNFDVILRSLITQTKE